MKTYWRSLKTGQAQHCWTDKHGLVFLRSVCGLVKSRSSLLHPGVDDPRCKNCERALKE